jgi:hypothetical protein
MAATRTVPSTRAFTARLGLGLLPGLEDAAGGGVERLPLAGDDERSLRAVDEGHAELPLELLDGLAGRGLRDEVLLGAPGERPQSHDSQ